MSDDLIPQSYTLPDVVKIGIASIIMTASELDNLISVALFRMTNLPASNGFVLVGKMAVSTKIKHLTFFTDANMNTTFCDQFDELKNRLSEFYDIRNAFSHGIYLGKNSSS